MELAAARVRAKSIAWIWTRACAPVRVRPRMDCGGLRLRRWAGLDGIGPRIRRGSSGARIQALLSSARARSHSRFYRVELDAAARRAGRLAKWRSFDRNRRVEPGGPYRFLQRVDERRHGRRVGLCRPGRAVHVRSREAQLDTAGGRRLGRRRPTTRSTGGRWHRCRPRPARSTRSASRSRRRAATCGCCMTKPASPEGYILSEMEVWGRGGPVPVAASAPPPLIPVDAWTSPAAVGGMERDSLVKPRMARRFPSRGFRDRRLAGGHGARQRC